MFEIGSRLREARERRGLELSDVERATHIRAGWLRALEDERFDVLPERVYAIGFVRTYARHVGLDEQLFVDELSSRLPLDEAAEVLVPSRTARRRRSLGPLAVALVGAAAIASIVIGLIGFGGSKRQPLSPPAPAVQRSARPAARPATRPRAIAPPTRRGTGPRVARLALVAAHGRCWLDARLGSRNGRELHAGMLDLGQTLRLKGSRIWIRLGAPTALDATLNGRRIRLPAATPVNVVATRAGVRPVP